MTHLLVLAGTGEARQLLTQLAINPNIRITASLAGATDRPAAFGVETRIGGFGGVEGLAKWCDGHAVDAIVDLTHPYAAQMSRHAVALSADLPVIAYARPAWQAAKNDRWTEFENWAAMAAALPAQARPFLAGGSRAVTAFVSRADLWLLARGLKFDDDLKKYNHLKLINDFPKKQIEDEIALLTEYKIVIFVPKMQVGTGRSPRLRPRASSACRSGFWHDPIVKKGISIIRFASRLMR